jgi:hypothetical protein
MEKYKLHLETLLSIARDGQADYSSAQACCFVCANEFGTS